MTSTRTRCSGSVARSSLAPTSKMCTPQMINSSGEHPSDSEDASGLTVILGMSLSSSDSPEMSKGVSTFQDTSTKEMDLDLLLKDKVITGPAWGRVPSSLATNKRTWKVPSPTLPGDRLPVSHCTWKQVSRMGKRRVPMHEAGKGEVHTHRLPRVVLSIEKFLERMNPRPKCQMYEAWVEQKKKLQDEAFKTLTIDDLLHAHRTCEPGGVALASHLNTVARRNLKKKKKPSFPACKVTEESSTASQDSISSTSSSGRRRHTIA